MHPEPESDENFEGAVLLEDFLSQWQRAGALTQEECDLLRKFKWEGFEANELVGMNTGNTTTPSKCASNGSSNACVIAISETADVGRCGCSQSKKFFN